MDISSPGPLYTLRLAASLQLLSSSIPLMTLCYYFLYDARYDP